MTVYNGIQYAASQVSEPKQKIEKGKFSGQKHVLVDEFTLDATVQYAIGDEVNFSKIPAGAIITGAKLIIPSSLGTSGIVTLGYRAFTDRDGSTVAEDLDALCQVTDGGGQAAMTVDGSAYVSGAHTYVHPAGIGKEVGDGGAQIALDFTDRKSVV